MEKLWFALIPIVVLVLYFVFRKKCTPGFYLNKGTCTVCPDGSYCPGRRKIPCPAGMFSKQGQKECTVCPAGTYCPYEGTASPIDCPFETMSVPGSHVCRGECRPGTYYLKGDCVPCPEGTYCPTLGLKEPLPCPAGEVSTEGSVTCANPCKKGQYVTTTGCAICPPGSYCPDGIKLKPCPTGTTVGLSEC